MAKQIVYHGSYTTIKDPEIKTGKYTKDFGEGFYCTLLKEQAIKWANKYDSPVLDVYEYDENTSLNIKEFSILSEEWLDFVINCRNGVKHDYDIVIGAMADDQIYNYVTDLTLGIITREAFWELAKFRYPTHQITFCTDKSLECLKFLNSEGVNND